MTTTLARTSRRWWILAVLALAQLTDTMDVTIVNIALPSAQNDLGFSNEERQWVITAYALAFGALLLTGGRIVDRIGAKRTLLIGLLAFGTASAIAGSAATFEVLVAARAAQGAFGALVAPAALAMLSTTFTDKDERRRAFAIYGGITGIGTIVGLILGGVLTEQLSWRWGLFVNVPIVLTAAIAGMLLIPRPERPATRTRIDLLSASLSVVGFSGLVWGFDRLATTGWGDVGGAVLIALGIVVLALFVFVQSRMREPLLPLELFRDRGRASAMVMVALIPVALFSVFLFLVYFLQGVLRFTPQQSGFAFLPLLAGVIVGSGLASSRLVARLPLQALFLATGIIGGAGLLFLSRLDAQSSYWPDIVPGIVVAGLGVGLSLPTAISAATKNVRAEDAGVGSALVNALQQIGGSLGVAVLSTVAAQVTLSYANAGPLEAVLHGYSAAFFTSAMILLGAGVASAAILGRNRAGQHG
jgi:EmrB/QacA subfamily drug resistance transporter